MASLISLRKVAVSLAIFAVVTMASATWARADTVTLDLNTGSTLPDQNYGTVTLTQGTHYDYLGDGETSQILFTYHLADGGTPNLGADDAAQIIVNGVTVLEGGEPTGELPGRVLGRR